MIRALPAGYYGWREPHRLLIHASRVQRFARDRDVTACGLGLLEKSMQPIKPADASPRFALCGRCTANVLPDGPRAA